MLQKSGKPISLVERRHSSTSRYRLRTVAALLLVASTSYGQQPGHSRNDVIYWSKSEFTIPFHVDAAGQQPVEVQLESSTDNGSNWEIQARDNPRSRQFRFVSREDGLYWFRIRTIDNAGQAYDPGGVPLKVIVDTQSPELSLSIDTDERGDMKASFVIRDANPITSGIRLEYQTEQNQKWVTISHTANPDTASELSGVGTWGIPVGSRQMVVRLIARDAAGNESEITRLPQVPETALGQGNLQLASGAAAGRFAPTYPSALPSVTTNRTPSDLPKQNKSLLQNSASPMPAARPVATTAAPTAAISSINAPPIPTQLPTASPGPYSLRSLDEPVAPSQQANDEVLKLDGTATQSDKPSASDSYTNIPVQVLNDTESATTLTEKPFYSLSKAFSLDYEVDSPASSPISSVELWGTTDGGKTWERWGTDPDGVSPFEIKVETEGLFGFRMVIIGANGLAGNRPRNGDNADAWIHVDTQLPTARIHSALYGKGTEAGSLVIEYSAQDEYFSERPIAFSYSELPSGPWITISNGLRNTGRFVWPADPNLPRRVYLRMEAHDEAGNIAEHKMDLPVDIEGLAPRGRIQGFRPLGN